MSSNTFGQQVPQNNQQIGIATFVMIMGATLLSNFFGTFAAIIEEYTSEQSENRKKKERTQDWSKTRQISNFLTHRLNDFYTHIRLRYIYVGYDELLPILPLSLQTSLSLQMYQDMILKSTLFELANPSFIIAVVRKLKQELATPFDYICQEGEDAQTFYFIKEGKVRVFSQNEIACIALLKEGCYFGEIGCLLQDTRSVSVRAATPCVLATLTKSDFREIMKTFKLWEQFLREVGEQRLKTSETGQVIMLQRQKCKQIAESATMMLESQESEIDFEQPFFNQNNLEFEQVSGFLQ